MDIRLPGGIDGLEATRVRPEDMQRALNKGCNGFVRKPIDIDELPKQVAEHIARASSID